MNYYKSFDVYSIDEMFKILNNFTETENNLKMIIDNLSETLNKVYAFNEIAKNPPQPKFDNKYFTKINIQEKLKNIKVNSSNIYQFYRDIKLVLDSLGDHHLVFDGQIILNNLFFIDPIDLSIKKYGDKYRMFADPSFSGDYNFKNKETIFDIIKNNTNIPIKSINGKDPFDFITNFGGDFRKLKSPQANFRYKFVNHNVNTLKDYPLSIEDLTNFTLIYDNGEKIVTDYMFYTISNLNDTEFIKQNKFFIFDDNEDYKIFKLKEQTFPKFNQILTNEVRNNVFKTKSKEFPDKKFLKLNNDLESIEWDYDFEYRIYCKVDNSKKMNIYLINNFNIEENPKYIETIKNCVELFDNNNYPIIVLNIFNQGGMIYNAQLLLELISPFTTINIYGSIRIKDILKDKESFTEEIISFLYDSKKCEYLDSEKYMNKANKINYGEEAFDLLSEPLILNGKEFRKEINPIKKKLKNPRKPTEILVYTDGYSFSAGGIFTKFLQYYGGAITAGYFPYPNLGNIPYDSGTCASSLFSYNILENLDFQEYNNLRKFNFFLTVPGIQLFPNPNELNHPLEYEINPVDEIVNIYPELENIFSILNKNGYDMFINESLKIFEKYKSKCNPNNKKLLLLTSKCDKKFENNFTHGGYKCSEEGFWTEECVASYCDIGYIFDFNTNKCVIDFCTVSQNESKKESETEPDSGGESESFFKSKNFMLVLIFGSAFIIIIIIIIIICILSKKKNLKKDVNLIDNMNLDEQLTTN